MSRASFGKRQREKERQERAAAKEQRRQERKASAADPDTVAAPVEIDEGALLAELAELHKRFEDDEIDFEDFTAAKQRITEQLHVE